MAAVLSLRPERVAIEPVADQCDVTTSGRVSDVTYLGDHLRARVHAYGGEEIVVKLPNATRERLLEAGDAVRIGWRAGDCHAFEPLA
jgi:putative spermidine/putrescine transport system ATP-binding protein